MAVHAYPIRRALTILLICFYALPVAAVEKATVLTWEDLVPAAPPLENPFADLSNENRSALDTVLRDRIDRRQGFLEPGSARDKEARAREAELKAKGVDVERYEKVNDALWEEIQRRNKAVATDLDGSFVRLPGYALPLEMSEVGVTEMLLVPFVGACIHVPPPPPNQTVFVRMPEPYFATNLYEPVWITGILTIERASRALTFVDGQADIPVGYALRATAIEPYEY